MSSEEGNRRKIWKLRKCSDSLQLCSSITPLLTPLLARQSSTNDISLDCLQIIFGTVMLPKYWFHCSLYEVLLKSSAQMLTGLTTAVRPNCSTGSLFGAQIVRLVHCGTLWTSVEMVNCNTIVCIEEQWQIGYPNERRGFHLKIEFQLDIISFDALWSKCKWL